jgi:hypothetical protein
LIDKELLVVVQFESEPSGQALLPALFEDLYRGDFVWPDKTQM